MRKKCYRALSLFACLTLFVTLFSNMYVRTVRAEDEPTLQADAIATVVGDFFADKSEQWNATNLKGLMKEYKNGIFETSLDLKAGSYEYKVAMNKSFDENYGKDSVKGGANVSLKLVNDTKVYFRLDYKQKKLYDSINNADQFKTKAILTGNIDNLLDNGKSWDPSDNNFKLDYIGGGIYSKTFNIKDSAKADDYNLKYKVAYNGAWSNGEVSDDISITIPKGTNQITIIADYLQRYVSNDISVQEYSKSPSLIGTIRQGGEAANWNSNEKGWELSPLDNSGLFVYSNYFINGGDFEYKILNNYSWADGGVPGGPNVKITIPNGGKQVVFVADEKNKVVYDSINNYTKITELLGLKSVPKPPVELNGPVVNDSGTVKFLYKNLDAKEVYLAGDITDWQNNKIKMVKDANGIWSASIRVGDVAKDIQYKFIVDGNWIMDPSVQDQKDGNSIYKFVGFSGRKVVIAGTIQTVAGESAWTAGSDKTSMEYVGSGKYKFTLKDVPSGSYEYKIAMGSWTENYGQKAVKDGANIPLVVSKVGDVTFYYNDDSHFVVDSTSYTMVDAFITGPELSKKVKLEDNDYKGIYSAQLSLKKGIHDKLVIECGDKTYNVNPIELSEDKLVSINFDPVTETIFNDAATVRINENEVSFDSKSSNYKLPFGAAKEGEELTFNLRAAKGDLTEAKVIVKGPEGINKYEMSKNGAFDDNHDKWTAKFKLNTIGQYSYYFVISNGSDVKTYSDDDGYFGTGKTGDLSSVLEYGLNIYKKDFKTPDWMKNGVVYQIFPDRFFDGDTGNDFLQKLSRGMTPYEFYTNWYSITEDPELEYLKDKDGNVIKDENGSPKLNPDYKGAIGDNNWSNEMYGGDLKGVEKKLDYLKALGVNILYFNPVGQSISSHRYDTTDYSKVDPLLGNMQDFANLTKAASERGMHIILDGVFNHVSDDSVYFDRYDKYMTKNKPIGAYQYWSRVYDLMNSQSISQQEAEKQVTADLSSKGITDLHYKDWFKVENKKVDSGLSTEHYSYEGWWGYDSMPVIQALNGSEYQVKSWANEIIDGQDAVSRLWLRQGSNGWRLDVANEVSDETWRNFRGAVKSEGDNVIIGEIWTDASRYILGDMYDSVMNYRFRGAVLDFAKGTKDDNKTVTSATESVKELEKMREQYPKEAFEAMLNLVDSHDTQRVLSALDGWQKSQRGIAGEASELAKQKLRLVPFLQMTYPGAPCIYYGDEAGIVGADDPDNRRGMIWGKGDKDIVEWYATLANIRNAYSVLRTGDINSLDTDKENLNDVIAFTRTDNENKALVVANRKASVVELTLEAKGIEDGTKLTNILNKSECYVVKDGKVTIKVPAIGGVILVDEVKEVVVNSDALKAAYEPSFIVKDTKIPTSDKEILAEVSKASNSGKEVIVSTQIEEVSKSIFSEAGKNKVKPVIQRGDTTITIEDSSKLYDILTNAGLTGLIFRTYDTLEKQDVLKSIKARYSPELAFQLRMDNNLPEGKFGTDVTVKQRIDSKYNDKALYAYYIDNNGSLILISNSTVKDGYISFVTTHCSDYLITDKKLESTNTDNNGGNTGNNNSGNTGGNSNNGNGAGDSPANNGQNNSGSISNGVTPSSGSNNSIANGAGVSQIAKLGGISSIAILLFAIVFIAAGVLLVTKRKNPLNK
ncbi:alpha-glucosidase C-terminal domain-containing protein [Clostridium sp. YIM B02505]|uniref:Alpha-glucosidase C-terminal domain-containing protein n=1 Tax=Clostridium yunnanense TaxID=2800325 RepID=A0ABS1EST2_9CLOT|nr:alpha-amylase family glycosyl hydrolase [Clostridium yunnanense]MBK1812434.1 alpha-glucosidase C-terminal domain-containing protein [Clostridium yunnanense]